MKNKGSAVVRGVKTEETRASMAVHIQEAETEASQGQGPASKGKEREKENRKEKASKTEFFVFISITFIFIFCECVCVGKCMPQLICGGQRITCKSGFFLQCGVGGNHIYQLSHLAEPDTTTSAWRRSTILVYTFPIHTYTSTVCSIL